MGEGVKPVQARSQATREKLLKAALAMYEQKGYHKTTVDDIAAEAGVSTGIAYRYFRNKKDLLLSVIAYGAGNIGTLAGTDFFDDPGDADDMEQYLERVLKSFEDFHDRYHGIHEELEGLQHTDEDVRKLYREISDVKMKSLIEKLSGFLQDDSNIREKAYAAIGIMEQHCHMMMDNAVRKLDPDVMRRLTAEAVIRVLKGE